MTPEAYAEYWREHWRSLSHTDVREAAGRISYSDSDVQTLCADAISALHLKDSDIILDIGCGKGLMSEGLKRRCMAYYGMDYVKAFFPGIVGDAVALPFLDDAFDKALLSGVLLCIPREWHRRVLLELRRVTRPGGRALISANPFTRIHDMAHVFNPRELEELAVGCGWSQAFRTPINPSLEQARYYFDMVVVR